MKLDNIINKAMQHTLYKDIKPRKKPKPKTKEQREKETIRFILNKIKTGDYDNTLRSHNIALSVAVRNGYVDRKTLTILKED